MTADKPLAHLVAEAVALAGGNTCLGGHDWATDGGRRCPHGSEECSQAVYVCRRCGDYDYGEKGGPGWEDCRDGCSADAAEIIRQAERRSAEPFAPSRNAPEAGETPHGTR